MEPIPDFLDRGELFARTEGRRVERTWLKPAIVVDRLIAAFDDHMARKRKTAPATAVNQLREKAPASARGDAAETPGIFTLAVRTGGGKTVASLALCHLGRIWRHL
jgi:CRISPR-associated endonuclease/helicase Cas3